MPVTITGGVTITGTGVTMFGSSPAPTASTAGWFGGGYAPAGNYSTVDRLTFATDTEVATVRGPLSSARYGFAGSGTSTNGWFSGGQTSTVESTIDRITYSTDTATASVRGPLSAPRSNSAGVYNNTSGWVGAGKTGGGVAPTVLSSIIDRITYATDTATATTRGSIGTVRAYPGSSSGVQ